MNKSAKIFALLLCALMLLQILCACGTNTSGTANNSTANEDEAPGTIEIIKDGVSRYKLVIQENPGKDYQKALETLQKAFEETFGTRFECIEYAAPTEETDKTNEESLASDGYEDPRLIFLGNIETEHPAVEKAKSLLQDSGFSAASDGTCLALYSDNDRCLRDLCELFVSKYIKNENGSLLIDKDISLMRPFTGYEIIDGTDYDFTLPVISINTENNAPITSLTKYLDADVTVTNTYSEYAMENVSAQIRGRGNGTWGTASNKKPYKLKFNSKVNLLGAGGGNSRDWVLFANPIDYTQLRNTIAFELARKVFDNIEYCTPYAYANLFVSGKYIGVYLVCEQVEKASHKIDIEENTGEVEWSEYLIELDEYATNASNGYTRDTDYFKIADRHWVVKSDFNTPERCEYVKECMTRVLNAVESGNREEIASCIDLDSCIDMYLLHEYTKNTDVGWSSFYIIMRAGGKIEFTAPWDFDLSSGNDKRIDNASYEGLHAGNSQNIVMQSNPIFYGLMDHEFFRELVAKRWSEVSSSAEQVTLELIDHISGEYADEFIRDIEKNYPLRSEYDFSTSNSFKIVYRGNITYLESWFINRTNWMNNFFEPYLR